MRRRSVLRPQKEQQSEGSGCLCYRGSALNAQALKSLLSNGSYQRRRLFEIPPPALPFSSETYRNVVDILVACEGPWGALEAQRGDQPGSDAVFNPAGPSPSWTPALLSPPLTRG